MCEMLGVEGTGPQHEIADNRGECANETTNDYVFFVVPLPGEIMLVIIKSSTETYVVFDSGYSNPCRTDDR